MLFDAEMLIEKRMLETVERRRTQVWGRRGAGMRLHKMGRVFEGCSWRLLVATGFYAFQWFYSTTLHCLVKGRGFVRCDGWKGKDGTMKTRVCLSVYRAKAVGTLHTN